MTGFKKGVHEHFKTQAEKTPTIPAIVDHDRQLSYFELDQSTDALGEYLQCCGVSTDDRVGIYMESSADYIVACLGTLKAGGAFIPLALEFPDNLLKNILDEATPQVIITKKQYADKVREFYDKNILVIDNEQAWRSLALTKQKPKISSNHLAFLPYTSGTTGRPKGVMQTHGGVLSSYQARYEFSSYQVGDRVACKVFFVWEFLRPLLKGGTVYIIPDEVVFLPRALIEFIFQNSISEILVTPSLLQGMLNSTPPERLKPKLNSLRVIWLNGEVVSGVSAQHALQVLSKNCRVFNTYSISETHDVCTLELTKFPLKNVEICPTGLAMDGVKVRVLCDGKNELSPTGVGELFIGGRGLARGYFKRPELDAQRFKVFDGERYYASADVAEINSVGMVTIKGRNDSMIKLRGYTIYLGGIEETLRKYCCVLDAVVVVEKYPTERLVAYVVREAGATWHIDASNGSSKDLRKRIKQYLPHYMVPSLFIELSKLPINKITRKLDRKELPALPTAKSSTRAPQVSQLSPEDLLDCLRRLWSDALHVDSSSLGDDDNFFDLGGHSIIGVELTLKIEEALGIELQGSEIYDNQTIRELAAHLKTGDRLMRSNVSLAEEASLAQDIMPNLDSQKQSLKGVTSVFITGTTGFLGAFLLDELMRATAPNVKFYCLMRGTDTENTQPTNRVKDNLRRYGLHSQELDNRIVPVVGDLSKANFGLTDAEYERLAEEVDLIFHCAASVNYVYTYNAIKPHTVGGTREIIKFACHSRTKPIQFVSSNGIFPGCGQQPYLENSEIDAFASQLEGGYNQAKWVAEKLVWTAMDRGLQACIYRPGNIGHHSETGVANSNDFQTMIVKACLQANCVPVAPNWLFEMTPVDFLVNVIVNIATNPGYHGGAYNIVQRPVQADHVFDHMLSHGHVKERLSLPAWRSVLNEAADRDKDMSLKILAQSLDSVEGYLTDTNTYDNSKFSGVISQMGLSAPVVDIGYVAKLLRTT